MLGPFGVVVGDPLVSAVKAVVPGIREYAVQYVWHYQSQSFVIKKY